MSRNSQGKRTFSGVRRACWSLTIAAALISSMSACNEQSENCDAIPDAGPDAAYVMCDIDSSTLTFAVVGQLCAEDSLCTRAWRCRKLGTSTEGVCAAGAGSGVGIMIEPIPCTPNADPPTVAEVTDVTAEEITLVDTVGDATEYTLTYSLLGETLPVEIGDILEVRCLPSDYPTGTFRDIRLYKDGELLAAREGGTEESFWGPEVLDGISLKVVVNGCGIVKVHPISLGINMAMEARAGQGEPVVVGPGESATIVSSGRSYILFGGLMWESIMGFTDPMYGYSYTLVRRSFP